MNERTFCSDLSLKLLLFVKLNEDAIYTKIISEKAIKKEEKL